MFIHKNKGQQGTAFRLIKFFIGLFVLCLISGGSLIFAAFAYYSSDLPDFMEFSEKPLIQSTKIFDRSGNVVLYDVYGEEKRTIISFEKIPQSIKDATIAIEDDTFYSHNGINIKSIIRAFIANTFQKKVVQGGSTITQQLIKNYLLSPEKTFSRKIREIILSLEMEQKYSKEEILEFYLNQIPYGANAYGIESAASTFFNKPANQLTLAESALLATLPKAPSYYSPYGYHIEELLNRKNYILERMYSVGFINKTDLEKAKSETLIFAPQKKSIKAPHFVMYIKNYLEEKYGDDYVLKNGLRVYTTLDWDIQQIAEKVVYDGAIRNATKYNAKNAALAAIDVKTGQILAMVGSYDYFDDKNDGNVNVTIMNRQPGSAFKPFGYATALEKGFTPETIVFDLPTEFSPEYPELCPPLNINFSDDNNLCYHPRNYDGKFRGPVDLRHSLAQSLNIPSVKVLYLAGIKETITLAKKLGITTLDNDNYYGLSLILGSADVKPLDMAAAYSVFANDGIKNERVAILKIEDHKGNILEEYKAKPRQVLNSQVTRQINSILSDNSARAPVFGEKNYLHLENYPVAAKTGTTQDNKDAWVIGYSPTVSVAVWVGNNNNDKIAQSGAGISAAGPIWNEFMKQIIQKNPPKSGFIAPEPVVADKEMLNGNFEVENKIKIDRISKKIATINTPNEFIEEISQKIVHSILYFIDKNKVMGEQPQNPESDPQFLNWELPILEWVKIQNNSGKNYNQITSSEVDDIHTEENAPKITITSPQDNEVVNSYYLSININISSVFPIKQVDYFADNQLLGSSFNYPFNLNFPVLKINQPENKNKTIRVAVYDIYGNKNEEQVNIIIEN